MQSTVREINCRHFILDNKTLLDLQLQEALFSQNSDFKSALLLNTLIDGFGKLIQCQGTDKSGWLESLSP